MLYELELMDSTLCFVLWQAPVCQSLIDIDVKNVPEYHRPSVKTNLLGVNDIFEKTQGIFIAPVPRTPSQHSGKVVA